MVSLPLETHPPQILDGFEKIRQPPAGPNLSIRTPPPPPRGLIIPYKQSLVSPAWLKMRYFHDTIRRRAKHGRMTNCCPDRPYIPFVVCRETIPNGLLVRVALLGRCGLGFNLIVITVHE